MAENTPSDIPLAKPPARVVALTYATPRCFIEGEYRHRSITGVVGAGLCGVMAGFLLFMRHDLSDDLDVSGLPGDIFRAASLTLLCGCAIGFAWCVVQFARNAVDTIRITEDGIEKNRRLYPWSRVASFGGCEIRSKVVLEYLRRSKTWGIVPVPIPIQPLTPAEFDVLIAEIAEYLQRAYPHVAVNPVPRRPD